MPRTELGNKKDKTAEELLKILDTVAKTGVPAQIDRLGKQLLVSPVEYEGKLAKLEAHPDFVIGDPEEIVHLEWSTDLESNL